MRRRLKAQRLEALARYLDALRRRLVPRRRRVCRGGMRLAPQEYHALLHLGQGGVQAMSRLARDMGTTLSGLTPIVDRLVARRLVLRAPSRRDRRVIELRLSAGGMRMYRRARQFRLRMAAAMLSPLSVREQSVLLQLMKKVAGGPRDGPTAGEGTPPPPAKAERDGRRARGGPTA